MSPFSVGLSVLYHCMVALEETVYRAVRVPTMEQELVRSHLLPIVLVTLLQEPCKFRGWSKVPAFNVGDTAIVINAEYNTICLKGLKTIKARG